MNVRHLLAAIALIAWTGTACAQGRVTAHVLDLYSGTAANGLKIELFVQESGSFKLLKSAVTNIDGRPPEGPLLTPQTIKPGRYQAVAHVGDYYKSIGAKLPSGYHTKLIIEFEIYDAKAPHHLPFQITPWTQSTSVLPG
ncbi:MAG: hydroxyisourate hydrolase [Burkholderiales bacterium]